MNYSDDGKTFVNGTVSLENPNLLSTPLRTVVDVTLSGARTGSVRGDVWFDFANRSARTLRSTYEGTTLTENWGTRQKELCGSIRRKLFRPTPLRVRAKRSGTTTTVRVTASYSKAPARTRSSRTGGPSVAPR
jgi:hypothetical protein